MELIIQLSNKQSKNSKTEDDKLDVSGCEEPNYTYRYVDSFVINMKRVISVLLLYIITHIIINFIYQ